MNIMILRHNKLSRKKEVETESEIICLIFSFTCIDMPYAIGKEQSSTLSLFILLDVANYGC